MQNYFNLKYVSFILLFGGLLFIPSCSVELLDDEVIPNQTPSLFRAPCSIILKGQILQIGEEDIIEGAEIFSDDPSFSVLSDEEGNYLVEISIDDEEIMTSPRFIEVEKDDYISSIIEIDFSDYYLNDNDCEEDIIILDIDFFLSTKQDPVEVEPSGSTIYAAHKKIISLADATYSPDLDFNFTEIIDFPIVFRVDIPAGAVTERSNLCFTVINNDQYLGLFEPAGGAGSANIETLIQRFDIQLNNSQAIFNEPIDIYINISDYDIAEGDELKYYTLNDANNRWELDSDAEFIYDGLGNAILQTTKILPGMVTNASSTFNVINNNILAEEVTTSGSAIANCDCSESIPYDYDATFNQVDEELHVLNGQRFLLTLARLQSIKTLLNISSSTSIKNINFLAVGDNQVPGFGALRIFDDQEIDVSDMVDKCDVIIPRVVPNYRQIQGFYDGQLFTYTSRAAIVVKQESQSCPTTSLCHQGCPE